MRDRLSKARRSWNMSRIKGKNTTPEKRVRSLLHRLGYRFRLHQKIPLGGTRFEPRTRRVGAESPTLNHLVQKKIGGTSYTNPRHRKPGYACPDIVLPKYKTAIFVHGCFWHRHRGCKNCTTPTNNRAFWIKKLEGNAARDKIKQRALKKLGWRVIVVWECEIGKTQQVLHFTRLRLPINEA